MERTAIAGEISSPSPTDLDHIGNNLMRADEQAKAEPHKYLYSGAVLFVLGNLLLTQVFISSTFCCASGERTGRTRSPSRTSWWRKKWKVTRPPKARSPLRPSKWWSSPDCQFLVLLSYLRIISMDIPPDNQDSEANSYIQS